MKRIIQVYCNEEEKRDIEKAAEILTLSTASFCRMLAIRKADKILSKYEAEEAGNK